MVSGAIPFVQTQVLPQGDLWKLQTTVTVTSHSILTVSCWCLTQSQPLKIIMMITIGLKGANRDIYNLLTAPSAVSNNSPKLTGDQITNTESSNPRAAHAQPNVWQYVNWNTTLLSGMKSAEI